MNNPLDILGGLVLQYPAWTHAILAAGIILQGEITIFVAVYLIVNGDLAWGDFFRATVTTLVAAEIFIYLLARLLRDTRFGWRFYRKWKSNRRVQIYTHYLRENMKKLFVAAKFLPGTNLIILLLTGWSRVRLGTFLASYFVSLGLWFGSMTLVAYVLMSELHYLKSAEIFREVEIAIGVIVVLIIIGEHLFRKRLRKAARFDVDAEIEEDPFAPNKNPPA